ncbi:hypothetical protein [Streptomyces sp. NPDC002133]|uniref:hypothetical protein n=1 Tax=Streptomyces sp. NPDC002133 TaxID=3154409 RepID=UPI0033336B73
MRETAKANALESVTHALQAGVLPAGEDAGLPLIIHRLEDTAQAHEAIENGSGGKVLIRID